MSATTTAPTSRWAPCVGLGAGILGIAAGLIELSIGGSIRSWIGDKHDTIRLGIVTVLLGAAALAASLGILRERRAPQGRVGRVRLFAGTGLVVPGLIGFTTVGRLWYVPGSLMVLSAVALVRDSRHHDAIPAGAIAASWTRGLVAVLGVLLAALGVAAHGSNAVLAISGGGLVIATAVWMRRFPVVVTIPGLVVAVAPFAVATWWSIVTPLIAVLTISIGAAAAVSNS